MIIEYGYAKLNLALNVIGKRIDGYHDLQMIVVPLQLSDTLTFQPSNELILESDTDIFDNAILKTANLIKEMYDVHHGAHITLNKHIPVGSGLGGESADIAATIRGLNELWGLNLSQNDMEKIALGLGSDTLFCLYNKTAYVSGRGEHLKFLENPPIKSIYLCISEHPISTKESFQNYKQKEREITFKTLLSLYEEKDYDMFFDTAYNDLLETAFSLDKTLKNTYMKLKKQYKNAYMTGSGSTLFVIEFSKKSIDFDEISNISERKVIKTTLID